jgi:hypothetical protein
MSPSPNDNIFSEEAEHALDNLLKTLGGSNFLTTNALALEPSELDTFIGALEQEPYDVISSGNINTAPILPQSMVPYLIQMESQPQQNIPQVQLTLDALASAAQTNSFANSDQNPLESRDIRIANIMNLISTKELSILYDLIPTGSLNTDTLKTLKLRTMDFDNYRKMVDQMISEVSTEAQRNILPFNQQQVVFKELSQLISLKSIINGTQHKVKKDIESKEASGTLGSNIARVTSFISTPSLFYPIIQKSSSCIFNLEINLLFNFEISNYEIPEKTLSISPLFLTGKPSKSSSGSDEDNRPKKKQKVSLNEEPCTLFDIKVANTLSPYMKVITCKIKLHDKARNLLQVQGAVGVTPLEFKLKFKVTCPLTDKDALLECNTIHSIPCYLLSNGSMQYESAVVGFLRSQARSLDLILESEKSKDIPTTSICNLCINYLFFNIKQLCYEQHCRSEVDNTIRFRDFSNIEIDDMHSAITDGLLTDKNKYAGCSTIINILIDNYGDLSLLLFRPMEDRGNFLKLFNDGFLLLLRRNTPRMYYEAVKNDPNSVLSNLNGDTIVLHCSDSGKQSSIAITILSTELRTRTGLVEHTKE